MKKLNKKALSGKKFKQKKHYFINSAMLIKQF